MHKTLIQHASEDQLRSFADATLSMLKETNTSLYKDLEMLLYKKVYGCHFSDWLLEQAMLNMKNEDGTEGAHWTVDQTSSVARDLNLSFSNYNKYDWNFVMNMIYSDYYGVVSNDLMVYAKLAKKFIEDKDAPEGKALKYYLGMHD
jgi:hypothetical protein